MQKWRVPFNDLGRIPEDERVAISNAVADVVASGRFILGQEGEAFEREWADFCGGGHAVGVASGTDALKIALRAVGVKPGDRVLTVANSAPATVTAILEIGARPVFCDVGPDGLMAIHTCPMLSSVHAVVPVHLYGRPCAMREILAAAGAWRIPVVEDACQAHGTEIFREDCDAADATAYSFYPTKNLGALGDAGAIVTNDPETTERCRRLRNYGLRDRYFLSCAGYNSRMDEMQAAILRVRLPMLRHYNYVRERIAARYRELLAPPGIELIADGNNHLAVVRFAADKRDAIQDGLVSRGIITHVHYRIPMHKQIIERSGDISLPNTDLWCAEILSLPIGNYMRLDEVDIVVGVLKEVLAEVGVEQQCRRC